MAAVVVPFRAGGKSRLPAAVRGDLALAMLGDVLESTLAHTRDVWLVTDDAGAAAVARALDAGVIADPGGGQGAAVQAALAGIDGGCLVVNADLPWATPAALACLEGLTPGLVAAADGTTNALALPGRAWFAPLYGAGSAARFEAMGLVRASIPELEHDVDTVADLGPLALPLGRRTSLVLNRHKVLAAGTA